MAVFHLSETVGAPLSNWVKGFKGNFPPAKTVLTRYGLAGDGTRAAWTTALDRRVGSLRIGALPITKEPKCNGMTSDGPAHATNWRRSVDRTEKAELVASLQQTFNDTSMVVVTHYSGLTVAEMSVLRDRMRESGAKFKVTKNRLTRLALKGTKFEPLSDMFTGPTAIAYSDDPVAAAKTSVGFAKENEKLIVLGGALGEEMLDADGVRALATLPSIDELRAKLVGLLNTPATKIAQVLQAPGGQVARVLKAYSEQGEKAA